MVSVCDVDVEEASARDGHARVKRARRASRGPASALAKATRMETLEVDMDASGVL